MAHPLLSRARQLRQDMTDAERRVLSKLRAGRMTGWQFRRQQPIGFYIVDFVCFQARLIVEIDGGQHQERTVYDETRDAWLRGRGFRVLRFWNNEVMQNLEGVMETILRALPPPPQPSPVKGEGAGSPSPLAGEGWGRGGNNRTKERKA